MKVLIFACFLLINTAIVAQMNKIVLDEKSGKSMLVGKSCLNDFTDTAFAGWWNSSYNCYNPDSLIVDSLSGSLDKVEITIVLATWCGDSRREVPRFYKLLNILHYPVEKINMICVDRKKKGLGSEADGLNIKLVPTFIFYRDGKELGRIIETPKETLEKDLLRILKGDILK